MSEKYSVAGLQRLCRSTMFIDTAIKNGPSSGGAKQSLRHLALLRSYEA